MNASAFDSAVVPLKAYIGLAVGHTASADTIPALSWQGALWIFGGAFALGVLNFLQANPVEKLFPEAAPPDTDKH